MTAATGTALSSAGGIGPEWLWRNGSLVPWAQAQIHVNAVGHASTAAFFEGIKAYLAASSDRLLLFRVEDHMRRFEDSARLCRLNLPYSPAQLREAIVEVLTANHTAGDTYIRPWAFPAGIIREPMVPAGTVCEVVIDTWPFHTRLPVVHGCRAAVSSWQRISDAAMPPRIKAFANYHNGRLAKLEAVENGHDWPVMLNERHKISEGAGSCIAVVRAGEVCTPLPTDGLLESITRDTVRTLLAGLDVPFREREIDRSELYLADEIFFMGTGWEILPVTTIDGMSVGTGTPGPVAAALAQRYTAVVRGEHPGYGEWLTEVPIT